MDKRISRIRQSIAANAKDLPEIRPWLSREGGFTATSVILEETSGFEVFVGGVEDVEGAETEGITAILNCAASQSALYRRLSRPMASLGVKMEYIEVLKFLEQDLLDPTKPIGLVRELSSNLSIRTGKFGDYLLYKKPRAKKPEFLKLNEFKLDYKTCDKEMLLNWIKQTYKIDM